VKQLPFTVIVAAALWGSGKIQCILGKSSCKQNIVHRLPLRSVIVVRLFV